MFGMGFFEILMVVVVAIIFLGPEKLPKALVDIAKFLKAMKRTIDDAKESLDKEVNLSKIKEEALAYKASLTKGAENITQDINLKEIASFDGGLESGLDGILENNTDTQKNTKEDSNHKENQEKKQKKEPLHFKNTEKQAQEKVENKEEK